MKNLIIALIFLCTFISCKKKKDDPAPVNPVIYYTMQARIVGISNVFYIDSTKFSLYKLQSNNTDSVLISIKYTDTSGKVTFGLNKGEYYYIKIVSRTYKFTYDTQPHYYIFQGSMGIADFGQGSFIADFDPSYRITGYGCTATYIQDPSE